MRDQFTGEPGPLDVTVTASFVGEHGGGTIMRATVENGTGDDGGDVALHISGSAMSAYGIHACLAEFERFLNSTLRPEFRLGSALAMGKHGAFTVVTNGELGPRVIAPAVSTVEDIAA